MAISRVVIFGMGTLLFCLLLIKVAKADESEFAPIHTVKHDGSHCNNAHTDKGELCREGEDGDDDDDVDDTFKVENKMGVSFSASTGLSVNSFDGLESEDLGNHELVLGH
ncbi:hypothetical protein I3843_04G182000 [Carya illinoinensis]|uniref:Uncharacterized protein n=1 Tax=Carya illinoinensis TaxID=32201 RepID=A0A922FB39_CARIL|nr:uncharacterized protein LOC122306566 [Carya illinoinensis]KAG2713774.1 hypothetical protein I3760_04G191000 [Carya illinoinensis]KAG6719236.1 hypothetical protein I3842_04G191700 [Carya illinoinensis]KAG7984874.1 hypothetical protein I3843_04G182000 [Carya illinoinensis]